MRQFNVAIVGATGAVGEQIRLILEDRDFPVGRLRLLASADSEGKRLTWKRSATSVEVLTSDSFKDIDFFPSFANTGTKSDTLFGKPLLDNRHQVGKGPAHNKQDIAGVDSPLIPFAGFAELLYFLNHRNGIMGHL